VQQLRRSRAAHRKCGAIGEIPTKRVEADVLLDVIDRAARFEPLLRQPQVIPEGVVFDLRRQAANQRDAGAQTGEEHPEAIDPRDSRARPCAHIAGDDGQAANGCEQYHQPHEARIV
jgi:hypothetical protein